MRILLPAFLLLAACGKAPPAPGQGRPEEVAKATFEALKAGGLGPLESHLMTDEERRKITGVELDDALERERWQVLIAEHHERLDVDWATAKPGLVKVKYDPMGVGANVTLEIASSSGTVTVDVAVTKVGRRFVFADVKAGPGAEPKQAAPSDGDDGG